MDVALAWDNENEDLKVRNKKKDNPIRLLEMRSLRHPARLTTQTLVKLAWTFSMFFKVASNFFDDYLNLLQKL